jgi:hypothetical protein
MMVERIADTVEDARMMAAEVAADNDIPWNTVEVLYRQPGHPPLNYSYRHHQPVRHLKILPRYLLMRTAVRCSPESPIQAETHLTGFPASMALIAR